MFRRKKEESIDEGWRDCSYCYKYDYCIDGMQHAGEGVICNEYRKR